MSIWGIVDQGLYLTESGNLPSESVNNGHLCTTNSTIIPIGSGESFIGQWIDTLEYGNIIVGVYSDQDSAEDGLRIEWSSDGETVHDSDIFTITAEKGKVFTFAPARLYFRINYENGSTEQTTFNLQVILKKYGIKPSSHRINDSIVAEDDAELVKSVISAEDETGTFVNIRAVQGNTGHNLKVSVDQIEPTTNSVQTIPYSHAELHSGSHYFSKTFFTIPNSATQDIIIITPDTARWAHFIVEVAPQDGAAEIQVYEGTTVSNNGTIDNIRNRNRNYSDNNTTLVYYTPTITSVGNLLEKEWVGSGKVYGGSVRDAEEKIGKQNTIYLLRVINRTTSDNHVNVKVDWYEHINLS